MKRAASVLVGSLALVLMAGCGLIDLPGKSTPPVANAGPDQTANVNGTVQLDGSGSSDSDRDPIAYDWTILSAPAGSQTALVLPTVVNPTLIPDTDGAYTIGLVVRDGSASSDTDAVVITAVGLAIRGMWTCSGVDLETGAAGGTDGFVMTLSSSDFSVRYLPSGVVAQGTVVVFDNDARHLVIHVQEDPLYPDGVPYYERMAWTGSPVSEIALSAYEPADTPEGARASTTVVWGPTPQCTHTEPSGGNTPPVAHAGADLIVGIGTTVRLDATGSTDEDGDTLTYAWAITTAPDGSAAVLSSATAADPTCTPDLPGTYVFRLVVNDGIADSAPDTVAVVAQDPSLVPLVVADVRSTGGYTVEVEFNKPVDEITATDPDNYVILYWAYELPVVSAVLDPGGQTVTLTTSSTQGQEDNVFELSVSRVEDTYGNEMQDTQTRTFSGSTPIGTASWGSADNRRVYGTVHDQTGTAVAGIVVDVNNRGPDGLYGTQWGLRDDIRLEVATDADGQFELSGLTSQTDYQGYDGAAWFDMYVAVPEGHERIAVWPRIQPPATSKQVDFTLYQIVPGTQIQGYIHDHDGNVLEDGGANLGLFRVVAGDEFQVYGSPSLSSNVSQADFEYNASTGFYRIRSCLAGGTYTLRVGGGAQYTTYTSSLSVAPGQSATCDLTVYKRTLNSLLPIHMTSPEDGASPTAPTVFTWEHTAHEDIQSYAVAMWSAAEVDPSGAHPMPAGEPDMLYYLVPNTVSSVEIDTGTSPMTISGDIYRVVTSVGLESGQMYYWGIYAFNVTYNNADVAGQFSGEPTDGLWGFVAP